ncbi:unnamed protein product [Prorocentrum cordatum]|uniref:Uncharacterized protein n=1 Tax=Prorocentrum cordatum TaxID=2364126 RepID=A0ABN9UP09_9DINO|nr:unnamed protein product [Polarella glacialis]
MAAAPPPHSSPPRPCDPGPPPQFLGRPARLEAAGEPDGAEPRRRPEPPQGPRTRASEGAPAGGVRATPAALLSPQLPAVSEQPESDSDDGTQEDDRRLFVAWVVLFALALLALGALLAVYLATARPCWNDGLRNGREYWAVSWPYFALAAPTSLAFAAWGVSVRRRSRPVPLHAWTRRSGACTSVAAVAWLALPILDPGCHGAAGAAWRAVCLGLVYGAHLTTMCIPCHVVGLRLRSLRRLRMARLARAILIFGIAGRLACGAAWLTLFPLGWPGPDGGLVIAALHHLRLVGMMIAVFSVTVTTCCGTVGLLIASRARHWARRTRVGSELGSPHCRFYRCETPADVCGRLLLDTDQRRRLR